MEIDIIEKLKEIQQVLEDHENQSPWEVVKALIWMRELLRREEVDDEVFKPFSKTRILFMLESLIKEYSRKSKINKRDLK